MLYAYVHKMLAEKFMIFTRIKFKCMQSGENIWYFNAFLHRKWRKPIFIYDSTLQRFNVI